MTRTRTFEITGAARIVTPDSLNLVTPYVLYEQGDWFEEEIGFLRSFLQPGQQAIDVGANYGIYTLSIAKAVGPTGAVWAFEPASSTAAFLEQGIAANGFTQVVLERSALSRECGSAQLTLNNDPELNALSRAEETVGASETVPVATLDDCLQRYGWKHVDFVKIDAEGEEANIIEGGRRFFTDLSPLILYEVKAGATLHLELVAKFAAVGFDSYRLVPGLDMLVPFDAAAEKPDDYLLNLFCCKKDCAASLSDRGLLLDAASIAAYKAGNRLNDYRQKHGHEYTWQHTLATLPYGSTCAPFWDDSESDSAALNDALALYAISQDVNAPPLERFNALETSLKGLTSLSQERPPSLRLASLARVARAYGARAIAVRALSRLLETLVRERRVALDEPFLAPGIRFDTIDPRENIQDWILAAALEELEKLSTFSSYYTGESSRRRLELIASLGYESAEMRRRLQLIQTRFPAKA
jgi:FkbM family methyltransferase